MTFRALDKEDPDVANLIRAEFKRQSETLELIASENLTSPAILEALGTLLTNKYAEGYPGRRYYGGTGEVIDKVETLAVDRARQLFGADYVNVQPHSGSQANAAVYMAVCQTGDRVMGMDLSAGGHLTHGSPASFSGKLYEIHSYGGDRETERIDYDSVQKLAEGVRRKMLLAGFSAYSRAERAPHSGRGPGSGGTDDPPWSARHAARQRRAQHAQAISEAVGTGPARNSGPCDGASRSRPRGVRVGTPLGTTRGMREPEMV